MTGTGKRLIWVACCIGLASTALAHSGVKNAAVKARMDLMGEIKDATAVLGSMAQGKAAFDAGRAAQARAELEALSGRVAEAFSARESDPKSEAQPVIWSDWAGFEAKADVMLRSVTAMRTDTLEALRADMPKLGASCGGCHKLYRIDK